MISYRSWLLYNYIRVYKTYIFTPEIKALKLKRRLSPHGKILKNIFLWKGRVKEFSSDRIRTLYSQRLEPSFYLLITAPNVQQHKLIFSNHQMVLFLRQESQNIFFSLKGSQIEGLYIAWGKKNGQAFLSSLWLVLRQFLLWQWWSQRVDKSDRFVNSICRKWDKGLLRQGREQHTFPPQPYLLPPPPFTVDTELIEFSTDRMLRSSKYLN